MSCCGKKASGCCSGAGEEGKKKCCRGGACCCGKWLLSVLLAAAVGSGVAMLICTNKAKLLPSVAEYYQTNTAYYRTEEDPMHKIVFGFAPLMAVIISTVFACHPICPGKFAIGYAMLLAPFQLLQMGATTVPIQIIGFEALRGFLIILAESLAASLILGRSCNKKAPCCSVTPASSSSAAAAPSTEKNEKKTK